MAIATGQITIVDYNDAISLQSVISSNHPRTVIYSSATGAYTPDWSSTSLQLTPSLFKSGGVGTDIISGIKNASQKWYYKEDSGVRTQITSGTGGYTISGTSPWTLTVAQNKLASVSVIEFSFECIYTDPNTGLDLSNTQSIVFQKAESGIAVIPIATAPNGNVFKNNTPATLTLKCSLWKGTTEDTTANYQWYQDDSTSVSTTLTGTNTTTTLTVVSTSGFVVGQSILVGTDTKTISSVTDATHMVINTAPTAGNQAAGTVVKATYYDSWSGNGWRKLTDAANMYVGSATQTLTIYPDTTTNIATFKCKLTDTVDGTGVYSDSITVLDYTDPYYVEIASSAGLFFKPGVAEGTNLTATLYQNGVAVALPSGKAFVWRARDKNGNSCNFYDGSTTKTGTTIAVTGNDVTVKGTFTVSVE